MSGGDMRIHTVKEIASVCHEANRQLQRMAGEVVSFPWEQLSEVDRQSSINGVKHVLEGNTPEQLHNAWMTEKIAAGWVYGEEKSHAAKTHPCLVDYSELSEHDRMKDRVFFSIAASMLDILE